ncbi:MAG: inositol-3-phosphate synthase [Mesorhizobium sp.]
MNAPQGNERRKIRLAIVGMGNCASSLVQAIAYCAEQGEAAIGVAFPDLGGYRPQDIEVVAAFDVDARKVGRPVGEAALAEPNCTEIFHRDLAIHGAIVSRGPDLDGVSAWMRNQPPARSFVPSTGPALDRDGVVDELKAAKAEVVIIFLPVGSIEAVEFYADCAIRAGCGLVNGIPVFIASDARWAARFREANLPVLGDDFKAQFGATIVHRTLADLASKRGVQIDRTYQLNVGGNTDFLNMMDMNRLANKRKSKTEAVQAALAEPLDEDQIRIGPSDYVPWLMDRKVAYIRLEGRLLGGARVNAELRLDVEDSPNAASEAMTAIRCARIAMERGLSGAIEDASAFLFKHPPQQMADPDAFRRLQAFAGLDD